MKRNLKIFYQANQYIVRTSFQAFEFYQDLKDSKNHNINIEIQTQ